MTLPVPTYLKSANIQDDSLRYEWDDWQTLPALEVIDDELVARLKRLSQRAVLAFACGTAEWIVYRYAKICDESDPKNYLETAWAMIIDVKYCGCGDATSWQEHALENWNGPIKRPIHDALKTLEIAFQQLAWEYHTDPITDAAVLSTLACYVMTDPAPYKKWSNEILERLTSLYPRNLEDLLGDVVPRQAIDLAANFKVEQTEILVNQFLKSLDYNANIFLSTPEGMLEHFEEEEDFKGKPYVFDMAADRQARHEAKKHGHDR